MASEGGASLSSSGSDARKRRVSYFYEPKIGGYYYGQGHQMKSRYIRMAHNLIVHYLLYRRMEITRPFLAGPEDIRRFHSSEYVDFLSCVTPKTLNDQTHARHLKRFNVGKDCPVFYGLFPFCQSSAGGSIGATVKLNRQDADITINWTGGLHHAKKSEASGFCYVNDIMLGILKLLKFHRVIHELWVIQLLHTCSIWCCSSQFKSPSLNFNVVIGVKFLIIFFFCLLVLEIVEQ